MVVRPAKIDSESPEATGQGAGGEFSAPGPVFTVAIGHLQRQIAAIALKEALLCTIPDCVPY